MKSTLAFLILILVGGGAFYYWQHTASEQQSTATASAPPVVQIPVVQTSPTPSESEQYPVPGEADHSETGPSQFTVQSGSNVNESDASIEQALNELIGKQRFDSLFHVDNIVRRIVVTLDNSTKQRQVSEEFSPLKPLGTEFSVTAQGDSQTMGPSNFSRYLPFVDLVEIVDAKKLVAVYVHYYPLFQSAYQDLGAKGHFNDRLVAVINDLLKTPDVKGPIQVARPTPHYKYKFVDNQLEGLDSGQKVLLRMGYDATQVIKAKLKLLRTLLIHLKK